MNGSIIRELCVLSVFFGAALSVAPEGSVKSIMGILCSVILMSVLINPFTKINIEIYKEELAKFNQLERQFELQGEQVRQSFDRLVIEQNYEAYIMDKANDLNIILDEVDVEVIAGGEGVWLPHSARICMATDTPETAILSKMLKEELGIDEERQQWSRFE